MATQMANTVNKVVLIGEKGYAQLDGPFEHDVDGFMWYVVLPLADEEYAALSRGEESVVRDSEGWKALAMADGDVKTWGVVEEVSHFEGDGGLHLAVETPH